MRRFRALRLGLAAGAAIVVSVWWHPAQGQKLHAILVGDTDSNLSEGVAENLSKMNNLLGSITQFGKITVTKVEVRDQNFACARILSAIERLQVRPDDVVMFYYAGHGFRRDATQTRFPEFDCQRTRDNRKLDMNAVVTRLEAKKPRLLLAIADACNEKTRSDAVPARAPTGQPDDRRRGLRKLFLGYQGRLVMSGAVPGEFAWYMTSGTLLGGFFTNQFVSALNGEVAKNAEDVEWESVAALATKKIAVPNPNGEPRQQEPQFESQLTKVRYEGRTRPQRTAGTRL